jgi:uncharacterized YccA/Bax inhibitor family protein
MASPLFSEKVLHKASLNLGSERMTISGTLQKLGILMCVLMLSAVFSWDAMTSGKAYAPSMIPIGFIGGLVCVVILIFKKEWSPSLAPAYAICEGLALGALSSIFGILSFYALALTLGVLVVMYVLYATKVINVNQKYIMIVSAATGGIFVLYLLTWILGFFGIQMPFIHESGMLGIGISLVIVVIAAMNLAIDFKLIEEGAAMGAPKYFEWYASFGLLVTLVWLYLEILKLLAKLSSRD